MSTTSIEGRISVDVSFADKATSSGVESLKMISLAETKNYATGKAAIVTGVAGTAAVSVDTQPTTFKNATGSAVSFASGAAVRVVFAASPSGFIDMPSSSGGGDTTLHSLNGNISSSNALAGGSYLVYTTAGTASYTIVIYGT